MSKKGGYKQTDLNYVRKIQKENSDKMEIGEKKYPCAKASKMDYVYKLKYVIQ